VQTLGNPADYALSNDTEYRIQVLLSDGNSVNGYATAGDQSQLDVSQPIQLSAPAGKRVQVTARLVDKFGKPLSVPKARIGVAIYDAGPQVTANGIDFDQEKGPGVRTRWTGLTADQDGRPSSSGFGWTTEQAQSTPKTVSYHVSSGHPTGGKLAIALYLPVS
jgi:hypothetical protein